jgi:hypothetical protein
MRQSVVNHSAVVVLSLLLIGPLRADHTEKAADDADKEGTKEVNGNIEVRFTDGSILKLKLRDDKISFNTPYGRLQIPVADIQHLDFATRLPEETARRIEAAIGNLAHPQFKQREDASTELTNFKERAYPALQEAAKSKDPEVVRRAELLLERLRETVPEDRLEVRKYDVIQTPHSKIAGRIENGVLKAETSQFGEVSLKLHLIRSLRATNFEPDQEVVNAMPDPGNLAQFLNQQGKTLVFKVTGIVGGGVWGTDVYTADSSLAAAAVHAGVLKAGQTGFVRVRIAVPPPPNYQGSTRNGVTSNNYQAYLGAYRIIK